MWNDNASGVDLLFYRPYAEIISQDAVSLGDPALTIGLFGLWGAGKSTLLQLIEQKFVDKDKILCININAWMFEGYEDAKSAIMEVLLHELEEKVTLVEVRKGFKTLRKRVDWFKLGTSVVSTGAPIVASLVTGTPLSMLFSLPNSAKEAGETIKDISTALQNAKDAYLKDDASDDSTVVNNIRNFRKEFEKLIKDTRLDRVVVLVDDLDRCQPDRIIETLEAIKLFLSVEKTTFIIAADENVIQYAIKKKYPPMDGFRIELDKEYIEKLIQLPVTVPELSAKDIQNYLTILVYQKYLSSEHFEKFVGKVHEKRLLISEDVIPQTAYSEIIRSESLSILNAQEFNSLMAVVVNIRGIVSTTLKGNPRQAKRFLNTYIMKKRLAEIYYPDDIDPQILAKLLVLYKLDSTLFNELNEWNKEYDTENKKYRDMRAGIDNQDQAQAYSKWYVPQIIRWVKCQPVELEHVPLNKYFYLTREILNTNIDVESSLSEDARKLLDRIGRATQGTIPKIVKDIQALKPAAIDGVVKICCSKIKDGELPTFVLSALFIGLENYRNELIAAFKESGHKITAPDLPVFRQMYTSAPEIVSDLITSLKTKSLITISHENHIRGIKEK